MTTKHHTQCAIRRVDFLGLFHLFKLFLRYCEDPEDPNQDLFTHRYVPKLNDFTEISEYYVRRVRLFTFLWKVPLIYCTSGFGQGHRASAV
jgi:hypothetical protein